MWNLIAEAVACLVRRPGVGVGVGHSVRPYNVASGLTAFATSLALATPLSLAVAQDAKAAIKSYEIPSQPISSALKAFAEQSALQLIFTESDVASDTTAGVKGELVPTVALDEILKGTKLEYEFTASNVVVVRRIGSGKANSPIGSINTSWSDSASRKGFRLAQSDSNGSTNRDAGTESTEGVKLEEIIVTAQKREQRAFDIPMSMGVLSSAEIERKGIANMVNLSFAAPGMMVQEFGPGRQVIFMRGVGNRVGSSALTSVYLDEVPATAGASGPSSIGQLDLRTTDLERVEVLKGPQGTLYGAGAVSGTIRFITADPQLDRFSGKGDVTASFTEKGEPGQRVSAVLNAPVVPGVFGVRVAAAVENNGGWIDRPDAGLSDVNGNDLTNVRLKSSWLPSDALAVKFMAIVNRNRDGDGGGLNHSDADGNYRLGVDPDRRSPFKDDYDLYNVTATYDFGSATLLSSSSYIDHDSDFLYSFIAGPETEFPGYEALYTFAPQLQAFSQEVRLSSAGAESFKWTTGVFYQDTESRDAQVTELLWGSFNSLTADQGRGGNTAWAAFADVSYMLTSRLEIGAGARYFEEEKTQRGFGGTPQGATFDKVTWRATASYGLKDNVKAYASVATGFRSGGFNYAGVAPYGPETLLTYELGTKAFFPSRKARIDLALFHSDYSDYLRRGSVMNGVGAFVVAVGNLGDVKIKGVELSMSAEAVSNLMVYVNGSYTDSELKSLDPRATGSGLGTPGDPVDYIPRSSYTVGAEYQFPWRQDVPGFVQIDYNFREKVSVIDRSIIVPTMYSDDIELLNARIGIEWSRWSVQVFGENLLNENGSFDPWVAWAQAVRNRPRTYGVKVGFDFK